MTVRLRLAQCLRCKAYTHLGDHAGLAVALDVSPATKDGYVEALVRRLALYDVVRRPQQPAVARPRPPGTPAPPFAPEGAQAGADAVGGWVHREHGCGAGAKDQRPVNTTAGKDSAPATPGAPEGGNLLHAALASVARDQGRQSAVATATPLLSEGSLYAKCGICDRLIKAGELHWGIQHGHLWIHAEHVECP